ncbi:MAG: ABC-F family ATP-binding cassette domain-containing protein [Pseudomonadota bacterium]
MLQINDLSYRIEGKPILENATAAIPSGHKVGLIGRNGAGKTTLLKLILGELAPDTGSITWPRNARLGHVAQEAPGGPDSLIDWVLSADTERASLLAEAETATDPTRIADIQVRLTDIDAHAAPARAASILSGLGFDHAAQRRPCSVFSGGWRMRVALAGVLLTQPEILLLDEPTNYLDLEGTIWLEQHLKTYPETVIIVSHDRDLLNTAVSSILQLDRGKLTLFAGGYDAFEDALRERQRLEGKMKKKQDSERQRLQAFIDRFKAKATKAKQAQSRVKALARMKPIASAIEESVVPFAFPTPEKPLASPIVRMETATVGYTPDAPILTDLNLRIDRDDRIALLGANGNGKSTFAKLIAGRLPPLTGLSKSLDKMRVGYFAQHQLDELNARATPYDYIAKLMPEASEAQKRSKLAGFGFGAQKAETRCENLSGGEKARLMLALTAFHAPHLMILDEPTNHLDVDSRQALIQALAEYDGAVLIISHDRHLVEATADRLWIVANRTVRAYDGDIETYRSELLRSRNTPDAASGLDGEKAVNGSRGNNEPTSAPTTSPAERRKAAAAKRAELAPMKKRVTAAEKLMEKLTSKLDQLDHALAAPGLFTNEPAKAQSMMIERGTIEKQLAEAEEAWLAVSEAYEAAEVELSTLSETVGA